MSSCGMRPYPVLTGDDARRFLENEVANREHLNELACRYCGCGLRNPKPEGLCVDCEKLYYQRLAASIQLLALRPANVDR